VLLNGSVSTWIKVPKREGLSSGEKMVLHVLRRNGLESAVCHLRASSTLESCCMHNTYTLSLFSIMLPSRQCMSLGKAVFLPTSDQPIVSSPVHTIRSFRVEPRPRYLLTWLVIDIYILNDDSP